MQRDERLLQLEHVQQLVLASFWPPDHRLSAKSVRDDRQYESVALSYCRFVAVVPISSACFVVMAMLSVMRVYQYALHLIDSTNQTKEISGNFDTIAILCYSKVNAAPYRASDKVRCLRRQSRSQTIKREHAPLGCGTRLAKLRQSI